MLNLKKAEVVGLDIGSSFVKAVQLHEDEDGYVVSSVGIAQISAGEDNKNHPQNNITKAVHECFESVGVNTEYAVCGVNGPEVAVRDFQFPSLCIILKTFCCMITFTLLIIKVYLHFKF